MPRKKGRRTQRSPQHKPELVIITGLSGSGKGSVLKALEDLGFYSVDNLPVELIPKFAELTCNNPEHSGRGAGGGHSRGRGIEGLPQGLRGNPQDR